MNYAVQVEQLKKVFDGKEALKDVSFEIEKGKTFGFLGPSGSGKTTTIKILTSQLSGYSGNVTILGETLEELKKPAQMKRIGVLTDNTGLYERLTVLENLKLYCELYDVSIERIDEVLTDVGLLDQKQKVVKKLSKGMKQRITLARTILHKPELLFLDEPTSALDPVNATQIHRILKKLNSEGTTIFLTTHNMEEAEKICDTVAFLDQGQIKLLGAPKELKLQQVDSSITLELKGGIVKVVDKDEEGLHEIGEAIKKGQLLSIHSNEPNLGDLFVQVTGKELVQ
ncbi:ABC transporter ATP-binding protein [Bacillus sp. TS-2]|nr:ABC transporter ATP-binding protein [Bacillus sp. TS-2]